MSTRRHLLWVVALAASGALATTPDPVVYIEVAKGYQGLLWDGGPMPGIMPGTGNGSGFVVDPIAALEGLVLDPPCTPFAADRLWMVTNEHVARHATELSVTFMWEEEAGAALQFNVPGKVVALDQRMDLALIAVEASDLAQAGLDAAGIPRLKLWTGAPESLPQGAPVQALGNPQGLKRVMTTGVVSAPLQQISWSHPYFSPARLLQIDAAINGGNSGGPLVLASTGEVTGVNSLGGGQNLNFAVPARRVRIFLAQVACGRGIRHGVMPFLHGEVDGRARAALDLPGVAGEVILDVVGPSGDMTEGVRPLDVVLGIEGRRQAEAGGGTMQVRVGPGGVPLDEAACDLEPGSTASLALRRAGEDVHVTVRVGSMDLQGAGADDIVEFLGAHLERVADWRRAGTHYAGTGLVCGTVQPGSLAAQLYLGKNDIVERVMLRQGDALRVIDVTGVAALREAAPAIEAAVAGAREHGQVVVLALEYYNLESRGRGVKLLRTPSRGR